MDQNEAAARIIQNATKEAARRPSRRTLAFSVEIEIEEATWQANLEGIAAISPIRDPEFMRTLDGVIDEIVDVGIAASAMEYLVQMLPAAVAQHQSRTLLPVGTKAIVIEELGGDRRLTFRFSGQRGV